MNVTYLECSLCKKIFEAGKPHNLATVAGRCWFGTTWTRRA